MQGMQTTAGGTFLIGGPAMAVGGAFLWVLRNIRDHVKVLRSHVTPEEPTDDQPNVDWDTVLDRLATESQKRE